MDFAFQDTQKKRSGPSKKWTSKMIKEELDRLDEKIADARAREGDVEIRDAIEAKALFYKNEAQDYPAAEKVFREAYALSGGPSRKMEILFEILQMNIEKYDLDALKKDIATCQQLVEEGADWDKKNKLKIYEGVYCLIILDFKKAADLLISSIATFTCVELMDYRQFVFYTVVVALMTQDRKTIKTKVVNSSDILSVIRDIPYLKQYLESFYNCEYREFFEAFAEILDAVSKDVYLRDHVGHYAKEMRLVAYR